MRSAKVQPDTEPQDDTEESPVHKALMGYYSVAQLCSTEVPDEQRAILDLLTSDELDRISAKKRLKEDAIFARIATKLEVSVQDVSAAVSRLRFFWSEGCAPMPKKSPPTTAYCNLCRESVELDDGCCQHCRSAL